MLPALVVTVGFFAVAMLLMSLGVMISGKRLSGSCGGTPGSSCKCSTERRKRCEENGAAADAQSYRSSLSATDTTHYAADEADDLPLPPPGEERLIQISRRLER